MRVRITGGQPALTGIFAVFGRLDEERTAVILGHLRRAEERLFALRDTLVEQTGEAWVCEGVMFEGSEDLRAGAIGASVDGEVDGGEGAIAFVADLLTASHAWDCEAEVWVYGANSDLRGGDPVLELPRQRHHSTEDAAAGYAAITAPRTQRRGLQRPAPNSPRPRSRAPRMRPPGSARGRTSARHKTGFSGRPGRYERSVGVTRGSPPARRTASGSG